MRISINTMGGRLPLWHHMKMLLLEETKRSTNFQVNDIYNQDQPGTGTLAVSRQPQENETDGFKSTVKCYDSNKTGHFARDFRTRRQRYTDLRNIESARLPKF